MRNRLALLIGILALGLSPATRAEVTIDLETASLTLDDQGVVTSLTFADGTSWPSAGQPAFAIETERGTISPREVRRDGETLTVDFKDGSTATFRLTTLPGIALFKLESFDPKGEVTSFRLFRVLLPSGATHAGQLNAGLTDDWVAAVMAAEPNVRAHGGQTGGYNADRPGSSHQFIRVDQAQEGQAAAQFTATSDEKAGGWSVRGKSLPKPLDLSGLKAIRAWVHGDGQGQQLKIQLSSNGNRGNRDDYLPIDFEGWRQVTLDKPALNTLNEDRVSTLSFYYNGLPPGQTVTCLIDQVEAIVERDGREEVILLEDFESIDSPLWGASGQTLNVTTYGKYGLEPAAFALVAAPRADIWTTIERFEKAAGIPSPRLDGAWNKTSPDIKRSYLFLTNFRESEIEEGLALAHRGGFANVLLLQSSWTKATGHYEINRTNFPDGLESLKRTVKRFQDEGFGVGLHILAASIDPPDPYLTPVPDPRLFTGVSTTLAADIDEEADFLPTTESPEAFPAEDGGYTGAGTVLRIGDELIQYGDRSLTEPFGFTQVRRGHLGTKVAQHKKGDPVAHLVRAYGYHMYDMDTTLLPEVAAHFAKVADACDIDMIYFDGSELLQGDHWYYNARLHKAFLDALKKKDLLLQASSYSHYSWHLMARSASADGHGDLKGYLEQRSPWFTSFGRDGMPLDIGWYYGYDTNSTLDQYEYILGATIGYDSSMSFQVSPIAASQHPFTGPLLDRIARYEKLRLSGRVPEEMQARFRIDPILGGEKTPEEREALTEHRREYRLVGPEGNEAFQRVVYEPWHEIATADPEAANWTATVREGDGPAKLGIWLHAQSGPWLSPGPNYHDPEALLLESFDDLAPYARNPAEGQEIHRIEPGQGGGTLDGVTQSLEIREDDAREGRRYAVYQAQSDRQSNDGWSAIGRTYNPPLDLSWHRGIGFWLRGDGQGGRFKLQLRDGQGAMDYYIDNDYEGWRYHQLSRPEKDPIDYAKVSSLTFYYNGLPGATKVSCGLDDVKALRALDTPGIDDPWVEVGGHRLTYSGRLNAGQYLVFWPDEPTTVYGPPLTEPEQNPDSREAPELEPGRYPVRFGAKGTPGSPVRARVMLQPRERHEIPPSEH